MSVALGGWQRRARVLLASVAFVALASCQSTSGSASLPDVELAGLSGAPGLNTADLREPALVNLWATWCLPCKRELPDLQRVHDDPEIDVRVIGVNIGDSEPSVVAFVDELGVTFEQYIDVDGIVQSALQVSSLPATVAIGPDGKVVEVFQGVLDEDGFRELAERAAAGG